MSSPPEKLAESLEVLRKSLANSNDQVIKSNMISRTHRERLISNGFLVEVIKGWYILSRPEDKSGDSTSWYTSFWIFCSSYLDNKMSKEWVASPEQSLLIHADNWTIPDQLLIKSPNGNNNIIKLPHKTSVVDLKATIPERNQVIIKNNVRIYPIPLALISCSERFFRQHPVEARAILITLKDASDVLSPLLDGGHTVIAGRIAGAFRNINRPEIADEIVDTMKSAGFDIREKDPFEESTPELLFQRNLSPYVYRIQQIWQQMREVILNDFPELPTKKIDIPSYLKNIDEVYKHDAYNSLSIEGYQITESLIERVKSGSWNPDSNSGDEKDRNAMAARGYWLAFNSVKESINKVIHGANAGEIAEKDYRLWYRELFSPSVSTGILRASELAGYRNTQVYIRNSKHIPLNHEAVRDVMPVYFDLLKNESEPIVRSILGHFVFVYIHPYNDGNGRIARFLMNLMRSSGALPWTIIPLEERDRYMKTLEEASVNNNIRPFAKFITQLIL